MIKRTIFIVFSCLVFSHTSLIACDVCGSSTSNLGFGLLADYRSNFIRLGYFDTRFKSNGHEYITSDRFVQYDLSFRYAFGKAKKIRFIASIPCGVNIRHDELGEIAERGLSDISLTMNYAILDNISLGKNYFLFVEAGGGLSLPTGKFDDQILERNLPENFNIGKGTMGYIFQMNAVVARNTYGVVLSANYHFNGHTEAGYHYGSQLNTQVNIYKELSIERFKVIPNFGVKHEYISTDEYSNDNRVPGTGGNGVYFSSAVNFKIEKWMTGFSYSAPITGNYSDGDVLAKRRISCQLFFIF